MYSLLFCSPFDVIMHNTAVEHIHIANNNNNSAHLAVLAVQNLFLNKAVLPVRVRFRIIPPASQEGGIFVFEDPKIKTYLASDPPPP